MLSFAIRLLGGIPRLATVWGGCDLLEGEGAVCGPGSRLRGQHEGQLQVGVVFVEKGGALQPHRPGLWLMACTMGVCKACDFHFSSRTNLAGL